ncbi:uncharacterized protein LACBIDRAFT_296766 [Laccaria bicolor S238N-H82]|uniref:Predicted protein n=1 Tax=Laccaria bicolor (strain S238N-H82 / ATCC MYA-4686) TaxID=486041 RepID=B0E323_LACBS|nr:uncharacterized protein LACBIDRAFT_296766 [Laccaria bicolor S238N-H82]EDQ98760.1 predicted protein [Laccaria bicolor S238N-H82]|eukprot:XP_001890592.1 predicted protein [Laccaria bicolor S238N-H82]
MNHVKLDRGTGKSACHLRTPADTGCVPVANRKEVSAVTCVQINPVACTLDLVSRVSAGICEHQRTLLRFHIS